MKKGEAFEKEVLQLIRKMGFEALTTKSSGDGGIDIIATSSQPMTKGTYVIQCKDWSSSVGEPPVRDLYGVVHSERANKGILITTSTFTSSAKKFAEGKPIELIDGRQYRNLLAEYNLSLDEGIDFIDEEQEKYDKGLIKLLQHNSNSSDDLSYLIQEFGTVIIGPNSFLFDAQVNGFSNTVGYHEIIFKEKGYNYEESQVSGNAIFTVKFEQPSTNEWHFFRFECKGTVASSLNDRIAIGSSKQCFVATAVYGDIDCIEVQKLRKWRDSFLRSHIIGIKFIEWYYQHGKVLADIVNKYSFLKRPIRFMLDRFTANLKS